MKFEAVLFDCDGVLVDSEPLTHGVLCAMLNEAGWALSLDECMQIFVGKTVRSEAARIEAHTGQPLTDAWMAAFYARRNVELQTKLQPIPGAVDAVCAIHTQLDGRHRLRFGRRPAEGGDAARPGRPGAVLWRPRLQRPRNAAHQAGAGCVPGGGGCRGDFARPLSSVSSHLK